MSPKASEKAFFPFAKNFTRKMETKKPIKIPQIKMQAIRRSLRTVAKPMVGRMMATAPATAADVKQVGYVQQIIGAVVDVTFTDSVPPVLTALTVDAKETGTLLTMEIVQHLDTKTARFFGVGAQMKKASCHSGASA